jgi:WD40 repeat protein
MVAAAMISGEVAVYKYNADGNTHAFTIADHMEAARSCVFTDDGSAVLSVSSDKSIQMIDVATGKVGARLVNAHSAVRATTLQFVLS